jgi:hypothetical protein
MEGMEEGCICRRKRAGGTGRMERWYTLGRERTGGRCGLLGEAVTEGGRGLEERVVWRKAVIEGGRGLE